MMIDNFLFRCRIQYDLAFGGSNRKRHENTEEFLPSLLLVQKRRRRLHETAGRVVQDHADKLKTISVHSEKPCKA